jgi:hypothetical protein
MKLVKVGTQVYEGKEVVAQFFYGTWYQLRKRGSEQEYVPCMHDQCVEYESLPDASTITIAVGEQNIVRMAESLLVGSDLSLEQRQKVKALVLRGVHEGLHKFGPFDPRTETRDFIVSASTKARNILVYAAMHMLHLEQNADARMASAARAAARILADLEDL